MYDAYFNLVLWLIAIAFAVFLNHQHDKLEREEKRLKELQKLTGSVDTNALEKARNGQVILAWMIILSIIYILWNAREALRVFFL